MRESESAGNHAIADDGGFCGWFFSQRAHERLMARRMAARTHVAYRSRCRASAAMVHSFTHALAKKISHENKIKIDSRRPCGAACAKPLALALSATAIVA
jgi:hypothetical protein